MHCCLCPSLQFKQSQLQQPIIAMCLYFLIKDLVPKTTQDCSVPEAEQIVHNIQCHDERKRIYILEELTLMFGSPTQHAAVKGFHQLEQEYKTRCGYGGVVSSPDVWTNDFVVMSYSTTV